MSRFGVALKGLDSVDLPDGEELPADPANCRIEMTLRVGPREDDRGDDFTLFFVTPAWLAEKVADDDFRILEYTVVIAEFSWDLAERVARALVEQVDAPSWERFVARFSRFAFWEHSQDTPQL